MKFNHRNILLIHLYPVVYGIMLLFITSYMFSDLVHSLLHPTKFTILRFFEVLETIINNVHLMFIVFLLMLIEALRVTIINAKVLILIETFLLFIYCWSAEIVTLYLVLSCLCFKIIQIFIPRWEMLKGSENPLIKQNTHTFSHSMNSAILPRYNINSILIVIGFCIGIHIIYSYFTIINLLSMITYITLTTVVIIKGLKHYEVRYQVIDVFLAIIPPFGVIPMLYKIFLQNKVLIADVV